MLRFIIFSLIFINALCCLGQYNYKQFTVKEGLPSNEVYDVIQDEFGYLWFATDRGISKYNGYEFENFNLKDGLTDNTVLRFYPQNNGQIWCSTFNKKLFYFHPSDAKFKNYPYNNYASLIPENAVINSIYLSKNNQLYLGFINACGFVSISDRGVIKTTIDSITPAQNGTNNLLIYRFENNIPFTYLLGPKGENVMQETFLDSVRISSNNFDFYQYSLSKNGYTVCDNYTTFHLAQNDSLTEITNSKRPISVGYLDDLKWIGYRFGGLHLYNVKSELIDSLFPNASITKVIKDHENGIWICSLNDGVYYINSLNTKQLDSRQGQNYGVSSLTARKNKLYIGFENGTIHSLNKDLELDSEYSSTSQKRSNVQFNSFQNQLYFTSDTKLMLHNEPHDLTTVFKNGHLDIASEENNERMAFGGANVLLVIEKNIFQLHLSKHKINDIAVYKNRILFGTMSGIYTLKDSIEYPFTKHPFLFEERINDIDAFGENLFIATATKGLTVIKNDTVFVIDKTSGLNSNLINEIYLEKKDRLWVCTDKGINYIKLKKNNSYQTLSITTNQGLRDNDVKDIEVINDTVWVATRSGLTYFNKNDVFSGVTESNKLLSFTGIKVNDKSTSIEYLTKLRHDQNRIEINYESVSFKHSKNLNYRYRLYGLEDNWNYTIGLKALYPSIPHGSYEFQIQTEDYTGQWNGKTISFPIVIFPPFYKTWWFRIVLVLVVILTVWGFFKIRILTYNKDIVRELLRQLLKVFRQEIQYVVVRESGKEVRIDTKTILYARSEGNYLEIKTENGRHIVRLTIPELVKIVPDPIEFLRIRRSHLIRIDKVDQKSKKEIIVRGEKIAVGKTYKAEVDKILF